MIAVAAFFCALLFILYVVAGYPWLLGRMAARQAHPIARDQELRTVSVIIAVRNGEKWIRRKLQSVLSLDYPKELMEVLVICDGCTDSTEERVSEFARQGVRAIPVPAAGKAAALGVGIRAAKNEILLMTDVRQELEPSCLRTLIACFGDPAVGVASGDVVISRGLSGADRVIGVYRRYESWIRDRLSAIDSMFGATGCLYAIRRPLAEPPPADTLLDDMYVPLAAFRQGYRTIIELSARAFDEPVSLDTEFFRKVRTLAGNYQILMWYPQLLGPANRMWFHYVSYKVGRLLLPYALLSMAIATLWLHGPLLIFAVTGQALVYGIAILDAVLPHRSRWSRFSSPFRTFVVLMAANLCAGAILFVPARKFWKPTQTRARPGS